MNRDRRGGGAFDAPPLTERQMISFSSASGARSSTEKSIASDCCEPNAVGRLRSSVGTRAGSRENASRFGTPLKALYIGVAAASYWLIGGRPRISSMVRSTPEVVEEVWSTAR